MSIHLGAIDAYLDQILVSERGTTAKNSQQDTNGQRVASIENGGSSQSARRDGFAPDNQKMVGLLKSETAQQEENRLDYGEMIKERLEKGERLSESDMKYLRGYDPALYQKAKRVQEIRDKFSEILQKAPSSEANKIRREVLAQAQKAKGGGDKEIGNLLVRGIEKEFSDFKNARGTARLSSVTGK